VSEPAGTGEQQGRFGGPSTGGLVRPDSDGWLGMAGLPGSDGRAPGGYPSVSYTIPT
jgi:hypothetical protein